MSHRQVALRAFRPRSVSRLHPLALAIGGLLAVGPGFAVEVTAIDWTWSSPGYVAKAKNCPIANRGIANCPKNPTWAAGAPPQVGPILVWGDYENVALPTVNRYYDWVNHQGYAFQINSVGIVANGSVGTNGVTASPLENTRNIAPGQGISAAWELSYNGRTGLMENARVEIKSQQADGTLASWGLSDNKLLAPAQTGTWLPSDLSASPTLTPIDKTFASNLAADERAIAAANKIRIQFFQAGATPEQASEVMSDLSIRFNISTADLAATGNTVYARVGGGTQTTSVKVDNNGGFIATGVPAGVPTAGAGNPAGYAFGRSNPTPDPTTTIAAKTSLSTDYTLDIAAFSNYTNTANPAATATVAVAKGDTPAAPADVTLTGVGVGPRAQVSGYAADPTTKNEGQIYLGGAIDGLDTELKNTGTYGFYRDLTFANIFGSGSGEADPTTLDWNLTNLTLGFNTGAASAGVRLFELFGSTEVEIKPNAPIAAMRADGSSTTFRVYLDPSQASTHCDLIHVGADYCGDLLLTTDVQRAIGVITLQNNSTIFKFDLFASDAPAPGTLALFGLGLAGLATRRRRRV